MRLIDADFLLEFIKFDATISAPEKQTVEDIIAMIKVAPVASEQITHENVVILPARLGQEVWTNSAVSGWHFIEKEGPYSAKVIFVGLNGFDDMGKGYIKIMYKNGCMRQFNFSEIGKTVFLTREKAEMELKKKKEEG